jgi:hypothetical protein
MLAVLPHRSVRILGHVAFVEGNDDGQGTGTIVGRVAKEREGAGKEGVLVAQGGVMAAV